MFRKGIRRPDSPFQERSKRFGKMQTPAGIPRPDAVFRGLPIPFRLMGRPGTRQVSQIARPASEPASDQCFFTATVNRITVLLTSPTMDSSPAFRVPNDEAWMLMELSRDHPGAR